MDDTPSNPLNELKQFIFVRNLLSTGSVNNWSLADYHMPNFDRMEDRTTKLLFAKYLEHSSNPDIVFYAVLNRVVNSWPALKQIDYSQPFDKKFILDYTNYMDCCAEQGCLVQSKTSYIFHRYKDAGYKLMANIFIPMLENKQFFSGIFTTAQPEDIYRYLRSFRTIGDMTAVEIVRDLMAQRLLAGKLSTEWEQAWASYYTTLALNYVTSRKLDTFIPKIMYQAELDRIKFLCDLPESDYYTARVLHIFGRNYLSPPNTKILYIPQRAITEEVPSFEACRSTHC